MSGKLDNAIEASLRSFWADIQGWYGREREMISLFCFRHLIEHLREGDPLHDGAQIGIEVAVPQLPREVLRRLKCKTDVCKDVVIWAQPKTTVWNSEGKPRQTEPLAVMEWKVINYSDDKRRRDKKLVEHESDKDWLKEKSNLVKANFVGYAVFIDRTPRSWTLTCARVSEGEINERWFCGECDRDLLPLS